MFSETERLTFVAINLLGKLMPMKRNKRYLLVITDRVTKVVRTIPLKKITWPLSLVHL